MTRKPRRLREGDTVAVLSPSWGGPSCYPNVFDLGLDNLRSRFGFRFKEYPTARMDADALYRNPRQRAEDVNAAFADPEVAAIFTSIGGDDSVRILPYLDLDAILANPKILLGFSDTTTLTAYLNRHGLVTYNGPSVMAGFAQMRHLPDEAADDFRRLIVDAEDRFRYRPYPSWVDRYVRWETPGYDGETEPLQPNGEGWCWLQGRGRVAGRLFGGCVEVLEFLKGTPFWPPLDFWEGRILFLETSEDKPTVSQVKWMLRNYGSMGALDRIAGILFGRPMDYSAEEKARLYEVLVAVVAGEFGRDEMPIVANLDFGHTSPQFVLPLGVEAEIDCDRRTFGLLEPAVA